MNEKILNEGNQIHNFISSSSSGTVINYGSGSDFSTSYGSDSTSQRVTVPVVPVPLVKKLGSLWFRFRSHNTASHLGWTPLDGKLGPAVAGVLVVYHIAGQSKVRNLRIARITVSSKIWPWLGTENHIVLKLIKTRVLVTIVHF